MSSSVIVEHDGAVAVVRLNRPEIGNAVSVEMLNELGLACRELDCAPGEVVHLGDDVELILDDVGG